MKNKKMVKGNEVKKTSPDDLQIKVKADGKIYDVGEDPLFLATKEIVLTKESSMKPINMFLPPGVSHFYIEKMDRHHRIKIRFLIMKAEVERLAEKAEEIMGEKKADKKSLPLVLGKKRLPLVVKNKDDNKKTEPEA